MAGTLLSEHELTRLRRLRLAGARVVRAAARGERLARQMGAGQEFAAHRAYTRGDDLRRVDWNVYGRLGQLFVKLFEAPGRLRVVIALDDSPTMDYGRANKWLAARRAAAAAAVIALGGADRVWIAPFHGAPRSFEGAAEARMIEYLSSLNPAGEVTSPRALLQMMGEGGADTVLMLAGDFQALDPSLALLRECARHGGRAAALALHAAEELRPELRGFTRLEAPGFAELRLRMDDGLLALYRDEVTRYRAAAAHAIRATGAAYIELDSANPLEPLLASLSRGGLLASRRA